MSRRGESGNGDAATRVELAQNARDNPECPIPPFIQQSGRRIWQVGIDRKPPIGNGLIAVIAGQPITGAEPQKTLVVLKDLVNRFRGDSVRASEALKVDSARDVPGRGVARPVGKDC
jgi:hypothetical protein